MEKPKMTTLKLAEITIGTSNPRKEFDSESINELAASIKEKGVLQPLLVRYHGNGKTYQLVCGERRYRASKIAGLTEIPVVIRELSDVEAMELQIIENLQRKDVHPMEEAVGFKQIIDAKKYDAKEIGLRVGKSPQYVAARLKMAELVPDLQKAFYKNRMTVKTAMILCKLRPEDQKDFVKNEVSDSGEIEVGSYELKKYQGNLNEAPFDPTDATLKKEMGACGTCPFNSACHSSLFPEDADQAICRNKNCFQSKSQIFFDRELEKALNDSSAILISSSYSITANETTKKIQKAGHKIYPSNDYNVNKKPEQLDKVEWYEDNAVGEYEDFDTEQERDKAWEEEVKDYNKEMEQYLKTIANGKFTKAFCVDGNEKGKYLYIKLTKSGSGGGSISEGSDKPKTGAAAVADKIKEGKATKDDINGEMIRVNEVEKRKREIDEELMVPKIFAVINDDKSKRFQKSTTGLTKSELITAICLLNDDSGYDGGAEDHMKKLGLKYKGPEPQLYNWLVTVSIPKLGEIFNLLMRSYIVDKVNTGSNARESRHDDVRAFKEIARENYPAAVKKIEDEVKEAREVRGNKIQVRLKGLKDLLKDAPAGKSKNKK